VSLPSGHVLRVPTPDETLRIKGYLIVRRNQVRDYLDVVALADRSGIPGFSGENRNLAVPPVDLHVREGRALSNLDRTYATGSASCL
jgi:hypothetical protein